MNKTITKTSRQSKLEQRKHSKESTCPECGSNFCSALIETKIGFFKIQERRLFGCIDCGCHWHTDWERK